MAGMSSQYWGPGPHFVYHQFGPDVVVGVYDIPTGENLPHSVKAQYSWVEVTLPGGLGFNGVRIVVVG